MSLKKTLLTIFAVAGLGLITINITVSAQSNNAASSARTTSATSASDGVQIKTEEQTQIERLKQASQEGATLTLLTGSEREAALSELRAMTSEQRCERLQVSIENRLQYYEENYARYLAKYEQVVTNVDIAVARLEELGVDVSDLKMNVELLRVMISELRTTRSQVVSNFADINDAVCGSDSQGYLSLVNTVKTEVEDLRGKAAEIVDFINGEIQNQFTQIKTTITATSN